MKKYVLISIFTMLFGMLSSQIITDRPDMTESAVSVGKGVFQIETGLRLADFDFSFFQNNKELQSPQILLRYGLFDKLELRFASAFSSRLFAGNSLDYSGLNDVELGAKYEIFSDNEIGFNIAIISHIIIPSGAKEFTNNELGMINRLALSYQLNDKISLGTNFGYDIIFIKNSVFYSLSIGYALSDKLGFYVEPYIENAFAPIKNYNYNFGLTFLVSDNFQIDASYGSNFGKIKPYDMNFISAGFSFRIGANK